MMLGVGLALVIAGVVTFIIGIAGIANDVLPVGALLVPLLFASLGVGCLVADNEQSNTRLMDACRQDHKEYECVSMLERGH